MGRRSSNEIIVITWRDIPAQVKGKVGDAKHDVVLPHRFQKAVDRAAMVAGKVSSACLSLNVILRFAAAGADAFSAFCASGFRATRSRVSSAPRWASMSE